MTQKTVFPVGWNIESLHPNDVTVVCGWEFKVAKLAIFWRKHASLDPPQLVAVMAYRRASWLVDICKQSNC